MTSDTYTQSLIDIVADLSRPLSSEERYQALLRAFKRAFPCDATALLQLRGDALAPLAVDGISEEALGRHFIISDHPRFSRILRSRIPTHFPADSELPDPYDGLIPAEQSSLHVHDCLGASLYINDEPWGLVTLDALDPGTFDDLDIAKLEVFVHLAEATVKAASLIEKLERRVDQGHRINLAVLEESQQAIVGRSDSIEELKKEIDTVSSSDLTVLICGETGVGKELVARAIHSQSQRAAEPLIYVNCAALPENLVESELFGHEKGAFSGAIQTRTGKFELADGGTIFLDEIGEIPLATQPKLLRALQSGEIQRVGSDRNIYVDVRIIAATNRDLRAEVSRGNFRTDLYHRLTVYPITVPPLRERGRDVLLLAGYFLEKASRQLGMPPARMTGTAQQALLGYGWPGNVRELEHCISRALLKANRNLKASDKPLISIDSIHLDVDDDLTDHKAGEAEYRNEKDHVFQDNRLHTGTLSLTEATRDFQRQYIAKALEATSGNQAEAARRLGMDRSNFYRLVKRLGQNLLSPQI